MEKYEEAKKLRDIAINAVQEANKAIAELPIEEQNIIRKEQFGENPKNYWNYKYGWPEFGIKLNFINMPVPMTDIDGFYYDFKTGRSIFIEAKHLSMNPYEILNDKQTQAIQTMCKDLKKWTFIMCRQLGSKFDNMKPKNIQCNELDCFYVIDETGEERTEFRAKTVKDVLNQILSK